MTKPNLSDYTGRVFGRLTVVRKRAQGPRGAAPWLCLCSCGKEAEVPVWRLTSGQTRSCGCLHKDQLAARSRKHGERHTRLYECWASMRGRCKSDNPSWGGKGITICAEWQEFEAFAAWARSAGYGDDLTLDRKDNDQGYSPGNCRWVTKTDQALNRKGVWLKREDADAIRASKDPTPALAARYRVSESHIRNIRSGVAWA